jgi:hypothetical protein
VKLVLCGSRYNPVAVPYKYINELPVSIKDGKILDHLNYF